MVEGRRKECFRTCVPLQSLQAAAGVLSEAQAIEQIEGAEWVEPKTGHRLSKGMFAAQVKGRSKESKIPDGAFCLFAAPVEGSRSGLTVLAEHRKVDDPENGGRYTAKVYRSRKDEQDDGTWSHAEIRLKPWNREFPELDLDMHEAEELKIIARLVEVLG